MKERRKQPPSPKTRRKELPVLRRGETRSDSVPPTLAIGSDGTFYLSAPFEDLSLGDIPTERRFFAGIAEEEHAHIGEALAEFARRAEPRALGLDGRVYVEFGHVDEPRRTIAPKFYGYSATEAEVEQIQSFLGTMGMEIFPALKSRPRKRSV